MTQTMYKGECTTCDATVIRDTEDAAQRVMQAHARQLEHEVTVAPTDAGSSRYWLRCPNPDCSEPIGGLHFAMVYDEATDQLEFHCVACNEVETFDNIQDHIRGLGHARP